MTNHIEIKQLISADHDGQTTPEEKKLVEAHLTECPQCQEYARQLQKLSATLNEWANEDLSPDLEQKIQRGLKEDEMSREKVPLRKFSLVSMSVGGGGVLAVILILILSMKVYDRSNIEGRLKIATDNIGDQFSAGNTNVKSVASFDRSKIAFKGKPSENVLSQRQPVTLSEITSRDELAKSDMNIQFEYWGGEDKKPDRRLTLKTKQSVKEAAQSEPYYLASQYPASRQAAEPLRGVAGGFQASAYDESSLRERKDLFYPETDYPYYQPQGNTEQYDRIYENEFLVAKDNPLSTFSIDVDTASYSNMRRFLNNNQLPPADSVRIEEMINYFSYNYPNPVGAHPFSVTTNASVCPWENTHQLVRIGIKGKTLAANELRPSNLVFLIDVSGSMNQPNKLPLLKSSFKMLVNQLGNNERVAIVVYAGAAGKVLDSTPGSNKQMILSAIDNLHAGGSTAGGAGIKLAYKIARENFIQGGNNRVILATDGDFNVGASSNAEMVRLIEEERKAGTFLTVLGFGTGNYKDSRMEQIADKGNGNYYYIDTEREAKKVLVSELGSTLFTIAKDVKLQIEFNPAKVKAYRLIGYENRILAKEDFNDDTKDAGELGAGHTVTALYEIIPADSPEALRGVDELVYQQTQVIRSNDLMTVKLRYKDPDGHTSKLIQQTINANAVTQNPAGDFQFASAVAEFGLLLRNSQFKGNASYQSVINRAQSAIGGDPYGYRREFIDLVNKAQQIDIRVEETPGIMFK